MAEQQAEAAIARYAQLQQAQRSRAPSAEVCQLGELVARASARRRAGRAVGLPAGQAEPGQTLRQGDRDPPGRGSHAAGKHRAIDSAAFADNRILVTGEGAAARAGDGTLQPAIRRGPADEPCAFSRIDGEVSHGRRQPALDPCGRAGRHRVPVCGAGQRAAAGRDRDQRAALRVSMSGKRQLARIVARCRVETPRPSSRTASSGPRPLGQQLEGRPAGSRRRREMPPLA